MLKKQILYNPWVHFVILVTLFVIFYQKIFSTNHYTELNRVKKNFSKYEENALKKLDQLCVYSEQILIGKEVPQIESPFLLHIFRNDSLLIWNTNQIPIGQFADLQFPTDGLLKGQNGWYYVQTKKKDNTTIAVSFLIKHEYSYQNEYLKNEFAQHLKNELNASISLDEASGFPIYSHNKQYLFSIVVDPKQGANTWESILLSFLLLSAVCILLIQIGNLFYKLRGNNYLLFPLIILIIRALSLYFGWFSFMHQTELYQPDLYGTSKVFPNFFEYILNTLIGLILIAYMYKSHPRLSSYFSNKWLASSLFVLPYLAWFGIINLFRGLIENSSIPMRIQELFTLNTYSITTILTMSILGFGLFLICKFVIKIWLANQHTIRLALLVNLLVGVSYALIEYYKVNEIILSGLFPCVFVLLVIALEYANFKQKHLLLGMLLMALYSFICSVTITEFNQRKEQAEKELYASQLALERDVFTEVEYQKLESALIQDRYLQKLISAGQINQRDFENALERRHFNGFWERYECSYLLFKQANSEQQANLDEIIANHGLPSELSPSIYYITDYYGQYSYIIRQTLKGRDNEDATLYVTLKSKKIPEEIGFPRLLISNKSSAIKHLENYSVAKYHRNRLVSKYGGYNYPSDFRSLTMKDSIENNTLERNGYSHYIQFKTKKDLVVLSSKKASWIDIFTAFSYLFLIFGLLLLPVYLRFYMQSITIKNITLSTKIQLTIITVVLGTLLVTGISSGWYVQQQYSNYAALTFHEKSSSIELQLKPYFNKINQLTIEKHNASLTPTLLELSKIHNTDINVYDKGGFLVATSRPNVFNLGLISEQINPDAKQAINQKGESSYSHLEQIGSLKYNSAYAPIYNKNDQKIGYINLQQFGTQEESEHQIQEFLVSVINIFILLISISTFLAIIIANWITNPLQVLQNFFNQLHFGKQNERIKYYQNDEIGSLVKSYNQKIEELELAAQQLAQSERESAWRDMAKQVAHEIKNPLTPMKLTVQHLVRSFDPTDPTAVERLHKVSNSLIEQIDTLTQIANEFANFAKMPKPTFQQVDLTNLIEVATNIYKESSEVDIQVNVQSPLVIQGDKEQLLRVFNNLIKNAIQSIENSNLGLIQIVSTVSNGEINIAITDNGSGMDEETKQKIFTPYFTTKSTGSGIGLAMVRQIIQNHGGTITFESQQGIGTTFTITLPMD